MATRTLARMIRFALPPTVAGLAAGLLAFSSFGSGWSSAAGISPALLAFLFGLVGAVVGGIWGLAVLAVWDEWHVKVEAEKLDDVQLEEPAKVVAEEPAAVPPVAVPPLDGEARCWRAVQLVALATLLLAMIAYARFGAMLYSIHDAGDPRFTIDDITSPLLSPPNRATRVLDAVSTWSRFGPDTERGARATSVGAPRSGPSMPQLELAERSRALPRWAIGSDALLLVPSLAIVLTLFVAAARRRIVRDQDAIAKTSSAEVPAIYLGWSRFAVGAIAAGAIADTVENALAWLSIEAVWNMLPTVPAPFACDLSAGLAAALSAAPGCVIRMMAYYTVFSLAVWVKWGALAVVGSFLLAVAVLVLHHSGSVTERWVPLQRARHLVASLSLPLMVVATFGVVLFAPIANEQLADLIRRWIDDGSAAWWGVGLTIGLAIAVGWCSWWQLQELPSVQERPPAQEAQPAAGVRPKPLWLGLVALGIYGILWAVLWQIANGLHRMAWTAGVTMLVACTLGFGGSLALRSERGGRIAWWAAGIGLAVLGVSVLVATGCLPFADPAGRAVPVCSPLLALRPLIPLLLALAVWQLSRPFRDWPDVKALDPTTVEITQARSNSLPFYLAGAVLVLLAITTLSTGLDVLIFSAWEVRAPGRATSLMLVGFVVLLLGFLVAAVGSLRLADRPTSWARRKLVHTPNAAVRWPIGMPVVMLTIGVGVWAGLVGYIAERSDNLHWLAPGLGGVGLVSLVLLLVTLIGAGCFSLVNLIAPNPPALFRFLGYRRIPLLTLTSAWFALASVFPPQDTAHDVRVVSASPSPGGVTQRTLQVPEAFDGWLRRQCISVAQAPGAAPAGSDADRPVVPMILVSTSGGGIRAAVWTTYVMDRVFGYAESTSSATDASCSTDQLDGRRPSSWIFAASGISGGSVGLVTYVARQGAYDAAKHDFETTRKGTRPSLPRSDEELPGSASQGWIRATLGQDGVSSTLGWMLFVETPWSMLRFPLARDRAATLEETWERWWEQSLGRTPGQDPNGGTMLGPPDASTTAASSSLPRFFAVQGKRDGSTSPDLPLLILNGASVESGCRFNGSVLVTDGRERSETSTRCLAPNTLELEGTLGATVDLVDFMCADQDLLLSTAAFLSARFPVISPSGRLEQCGEPPAPEPSGSVASTRQAPDPVRSSVIRSNTVKPQTFVVDGGYHESSGAGTALDLWLAVEPYVEAYNRDPNRPVSIVPFMIQIDNGYSEPASPGVVAGSPQFVVPLVTMAASVSANHERARQTARLVFAKPYDVAPGARYCDPRYAHFSVRAHPGAAAPLGWTLSRVSVDDLLVQYKQHVKDEEVEQEVQGWLGLAKGSSTTLESECQNNPAR